MASADKRARLLSGLLAAKGGTSGDGSGPAEPASVIPIAARRPSDDHPGESPAATGVLYSKGAATASTFRPSYWSFDHDQQSGAKAAPAKTEPAAPPALVTPPVPAPQSKRLRINFVVAFGCVALLVSTTLFVLSRQHPVETPAKPTTVATAPVPSPISPAPVAPPPTTPPADSIAARPAPASVAAPAASSEPPPSTVAADPADKPPAEIVASNPAPTPAPAADPRQADALLARGDDLLATGDVAAARLFYQRAAELGSAAAATAVGQTYDPGVLELLRVRGARGDVQVAAEWYRKAIAAGDRQAEIRLKRLLARSPG